MRQMRSSAHQGNFIIGGSAAVTDPDAMLKMQSEIDRLQDAKRCALALADELSKENVRLTAENESLRSLTSLVEALESTQERMWCSSCGTVTRTMDCDCTKMETGTQNLVNYADSMCDELQNISAANDLLRMALAQALGESKRDPEP
jgi:hypothetical protein